MKTIVAFDIGIKNFAFCVETYDETKIPKSPKKIYDENGCPEGNYKKFLEQVYSIGELKKMEVINIDEYCKNNNISNIYLGLTYILNTFNNLWDIVDEIYIEQQMAYGHNKSNITALRISQHCQSYFITIYGGFKFIKEFPSTYKTRLLGCPITKRKTHKDRKMFAIQKTNDILKLKQQQHITELFQTFKKKDDISDCILMLQCAKFLGLNK